MNIVQHPLSTAPTDDGLSSILSKDYKLTAKLVLASSVHLQQIDRHQLALPSYSKEQSTYHIPMVVS